MRLIEAVLSYWEPDDLQESLGISNEKDRGSSTGLVATRLLLRAARELPELAWTMLIPHICRLAPQTDEPTRPLELWLDGDGRERYRQGHECIPHCSSAAIEAGRELARRDDLSFWKRTEELRSHELHVIQFILVETYINLVPEFADAALGWLIEDPSRLSIGTGHYEPKWMPAARLIAALSQFRASRAFNNWRTQLFIITRQTSFETLHGRSLVGRGDTLMTTGDVLSTFSFHHCALNAETK